MPDSITFWIGKLKLTFSVAEQSWIDLHNPELRWDLLPGEDRIEALTRIREEFYT